MASIVRTQLKKVELQTGNLIAVGCMLLFGGLIAGWTGAVTEIVGVTCNGPNSFPIVRVQTLSQEAAGQSDRRLVCYPGDLKLVRENAQLNEIIVVSGPHVN